MTGVTFHWIEFVGYEEGQISARSKNSITFRQYGTVIGGVLEDFNHGYDVEAGRLERELFTQAYESWNLALKGSQIGKLDVDAYNRSRVMSDFLGVAAVSAAEVQNAAAA